MKQLKNILIFVFIITTFSCNSSGDKFIGNWQSNNYSMTIRQDEKEFIIDVQVLNSKALFSEYVQGKHRATIRGNKLITDIDIQGMIATNSGKLILSNNGNTLHWVNEEWRKIK